MHRLPTISFKRPIPEPDELEESGLSKRRRVHAAGSYETWNSLVVCDTGRYCRARLLNDFAIFPTCYHGGSDWAPHGLCSLWVFPQKEEHPPICRLALLYGFSLGTLCLDCDLRGLRAPKLTADAVLTTFGYALVTTFSGMLLRLLVVQFRDTLPDRLVHAERH